jgi:hypothetical protein
MSAKENIQKLPEYCFGVLLSEGKAIKIRVGEGGYYPTLMQPPNCNVEVFVNEVNKGMGVTVEQRMAMEHGSMWGWETPGADPDYWKNRLGKGLAQ